MEPVKPSLLFVNKNQSSSTLSQSQPDEKSRILSHVQSKRRREQTKQKEPAWKKYTSSMTLDEDKSESAGASEAQGFSSASDLTPIQTALPHLTQTYPTNNGSDPFHSTVAADDAGNHALLRHTFEFAAKKTFLAEAFAPLPMALSEISTRHDDMMLHRMRQCVEDAALMYSTLVYGSSLLAWTTGVLHDNRPREYFIGKALHAVRMVLSEPDPRADTWTLLSIYALAITELWNGTPTFWVRCPEVYHAGLEADRPSSIAASRAHLNALLHLVDKAGGWSEVHPYVMESVILADKYLAFTDMSPPIIDPLIFDPGPMSESMKTELSVPRDTLHKLGESFLNIPICHQLRLVLEEIIDYLRMAHDSWLSQIITSDLESWLFSRLQSITYRLLLLHSLPKLDNCIRLATLTFILNSTQYYGSQVAADKVIPHLRSAIVAATSGEEILGDRLLFWCLCTGAMTTIPSPEQEWFIAMAAHISPQLLSELTEDAFREELDVYLFLPEIQNGQLLAMIGKILILDSDV